MRVLYNSLCLAIMRVIERAFHLADTSLSSGIVINVFLAVVLGASMKRMWALINTL